LICFRRRSQGAAFFVAYASRPRAEELKSDGLVERGVPIDSRLTLASACCLGLLPALTARADLEWRGTIVRGETPTFALTDTATGEARWVPLGGRFASYSIDQYDAQRQLLVLNSSAGRKELTLASARITPSTATAPANEGDDLASLTGLPLADALARRGDEQLREMLAQHRNVRLKVEDLMRRINDAERAARGSSTGRAAIPGREGDPAPPSALPELRKELEAARSDSAALTAQIETTALEHRDRPQPRP
jgi:hypothetical protein